jgi:D-arabinose 1-dehydrogenase-like Zn-dependent alcohol dehydrogenase
MFRFAVDRNVRPSVECFPMTDGNTALKRLADRQIRYRAVLTQDWS